jgi:predicted DNA-binding WGR domain protein
MTALCVGLQARSAAHRCFRAYEIAVAVDLFGMWIVEINYGRIGTTGRTKIRSFPTTEEAQTQVKACLRKRAGAPRRIGAGYRIKGVTGSEEWREPKLRD